MVVALTLDRRDTRIASIEWLLERAALSSCSFPGLFCVHIYIMMHAATARVRVAWRAVLKI